MQQPLLEIDGITKSFGPVCVLGGISLRVAAGEVVGLVGENGAGKSTLMNIVSGGLAQDHGSMRLAGQPHAPASAKDGFAAGIRFVRQELSLVGALTVAENLFLGDYRAGPTGFISRRRLGEAAEELLRAVGLDWISLNAVVSTLRAGEQQLVEIAKALRSAPRLLILDEPTSSLTSVEARLLFDRMRDLAARGAAIMFITHRLEEALSQCNRIVVLRDGNLVSDRLASATGQEQIIREMVGRETVFAYRGTERVSGEPRVVIEGLTDGGLLAPVDLKVWPGEVLGVFGLVGSGRTELLETLFGFRRAARGRVSVAGRSQTVRNSRVKLKGFRMVPEGRKTRGILPGHSVRRNISASSLQRFAPFGFMQTGEEAREADTLASRLGVRMQSPLQAIVNLSGGNQQKTILARALQSVPEVLLLDEPTHGVDVGAKRDIYDIIHRQAANGLSVIVASSELPEILAIADRCAVLSAGRLAGVLERRDMSEQAILRLAFAHQTGAGR